MEKKKVNIGLDLGIASVGWAVVNQDEFEIIDAGVRLFSEANLKLNGTQVASDRREMRSARRMKRRKNIRLDKLLKLFVEYNYLHSKKDFFKISNKRFSSISELKNVGLNEKISLEEMLLIFYNSLKKRGTFNLNKDLLDNKKINDILLKEIQQKYKGLTEKEQKEKLIKEKERRSKNFPSKIQLNSFKETGKITGVLNNFPHKMYEEELWKIIKKQEELNSFKLSDDFLYNFFNEKTGLFNRKREYWSGPNIDPTNKTNWSWMSETDEETQKNFYERLIGKDSYNHNENRAPKHGMYAEIFNLLNDLNNLKINNVNSETGKFTKEQKIKFINNLFPSKKVLKIDKKYIADFLEVEVDDITGNRVDDKGNFVFTEFKALNAIFNNLKKAKIRIDWLNYENIELIDKIINFLTISQDEKNATELLTPLLKEYLPKDYLEIVKVLVSLIDNDNFSGSHSLSNLTIKEVLPDMINQPKNFMSLGKKKDYKFDFNSNYSYVPILREVINNAYISPVVKRTWIQSLEVLRELQIYCKKNNYKIESIIIELAREKNSNDYNSFEKFLESQNKIEEKEATSKVNNLISLKNKKTKLKFLLAIEQDFKCLYCNREISPSELELDNSAYEIDHIIPWSVIPTSKKENLVVVHSDENRKKSNRSAYDYMRSFDSQIKPFIEYKNRINIAYAKLLNPGEKTKQNNLKKKYIKRKINHLLDSTNFSDPKERREFINRNLNDTRYASVEVSEYLRFFENKFGYKVETTNGWYTDELKMKIFSLKQNKDDKKNRDDYKHHAIDTIVIAYSSNIRKKIIHNKDYTRKEIEDELRKEYSEHRNYILNEFNYKFSKKSNPNFNRQLTDDNIVSFRKDEKSKKNNKDFLRVSSISLKDGDIKVLDAIFSNKIDYETHIETPMEIHDNKMFSELKNIYNAYKIGTKETVKGEEHEIINPFYFHSEILGNKIYLHNKIGNPEITKLKYYSSPIKNLLKMSKKYKDIKDNKIVGLISLKPIWIDIYEHKNKNIKNEDKYRIFPVNINVLEKQQFDETKPTIDNEKYKKAINENPKNDIDLNQYEKILELFPRGSFVRITSTIAGGKKDNKEIQYKGEIFEFVSGGTTSNEKKIELDTYTHRKGKRIYISMNNLIKIEKVNINILGTKMNFVEKEKFDSKTIDNL